MLRLCMLKAGDYFSLNDNIYLLKDPKHGVCETLDGERKKFPTMIFIEKTDKPKPKKKKILNEQEPLSDSIRLRDGLGPEQVGPVGDSPDSSSPSGLTQP